MDAGNRDREVATELLPHICVYKDGTVERLTESPFVPPSPQDPHTNVSSKDITISQDPQILARLYLPHPSPSPSRNLPILVYFHGGGFCFESAFSLHHHRYLNALVSQSKVLAVSVEYRLAPEHPLPAAYDDCWAALQWVASHSEPGSLNRDPWLADYADFDRLFIGGDSAGANIAHNIAMRAGIESLQGGMRIQGALLGHPYFLGSDPIGSKGTRDREEDLPCRVWKFVYPGKGIDDPMINPVGSGAPSLGGLGCGRLLVCVAEKDVVRDRGVAYGEAVRASGWKGEVEMFEAEGEDHTFHIYNPHSENAKLMIKRIASFVEK
ncbi:2-hydroxyisoflavanone dehydratase-like [Malania oleifera]|uniref:2-hydroxyisoflavanone dehydratase-like n=1 Tax=Malania oleifera TaxID=397392 RepID=UPI0025AE87D5|nr:2-hydroxyisoflavanone dehydratase-like [Malania oleifera]